MKLNELIPHPKNPRKISSEQLERLRKSLEKFGDLSGIIYNKKLNHLVGGHQRVKELPPDAEVTFINVYDPPTAVGTVAEGHISVYGEKFKYREVYWDEDMEKAAMVAANKHGGEWELDGLKEILLELKENEFDLDLTGFDSLELKNLLEDPFTKYEAGCDEDEVPEQVEPKTKPGDLYILGNHRLLCGDSTNIQHIERLMNGEKADMVFTDPPYGISFKSKNVGGLGKDTSGRQIKNDDSTEVARDSWLIISLLKCPSIIWGGNYFTDFLPVNGKWYVWNKLAFDKPNQNFSHCELAWSNIPGDQVEMISHVWDGAFRSGNKQDECKSRVHPNQKPVGMIEKMLFDGNILDLFGGSGSTLIACEKTGRKCFMMEIDPHYCDVIVERYEKYSGKKAILQENSL